MIPKYVYCSDTTALATELLANHPKYIGGDEVEGYTFKITKNPTKRNGDLTLALVVANDGEKMEVLQDLHDKGIINILGTIDEVNADAEKLAIFKSVYDFTIPIDSVDEDGNAIQIEQNQEWVRLA